MREIAQVMGYTVGAMHRIEGVGGMYSCGDMHGLCLYGSGVVCICPGQITGICAYRSGFRDERAETTKHVCCPSSEIPSSLQTESFYILDSGLPTKPSLIYLNYRLTGTEGTAESI